MGFMDRFLRRATSDAQILNAADESRPQKIDAPQIVVGASHVKDEEPIQSFSNNNITFSGALAGYDYSKILRDKQGNIVSLYQ